MAWLIYIWSFNVCFSFNFLLIQKFQVYLFNSTTIRTFLPTQTGIPMIMAGTAIPATSVIPTGAPTNVPSCQRIFFFLLHGFFPQNVQPDGLKSQKIANCTSYLMRLWHFSSSLSTHAQQSSGARCLIFGWTLRLFPYFMCANSEGSGETARMHRLAWAFAGRLCDKYHNLMSWLWLPCLIMTLLLTGP